MKRRRINHLRIVIALSLCLLVVPILYAELINDGSFENNPTSWTQFVNSNCLAGIGDWSGVVGGPPTFDGQQMVWLGGQCGNGVRGNNGVFQEITIQPDAAILSFWYYPINNTPNFQGNDNATVFINESLIWSINLDQIAQPTNWNNALIDISQFADQTALLTFEIEQDNDSDVVNLFTDYVEFLHPSVQITQSLTPEFISLGSDFDVTYFIENSGDTILNNVSVTNSSFINCDRVAGDLPDINPGESGSFTCTVSNATFGMENTATIQATATEIEYEVEAEDTISPNVFDPVIELTIDPENVSIKDGESVTFVITAVNSGSTPLVDVLIGSGQLPGCALALNNLAAQGTAVFNCTYTPESSETIVFKATGEEPNSGQEVVAETAVNIEILPIEPPSIPTYSLFLPLVTNNFITQNALGEPNNSCDNAFPLSLNQTKQFLAEDVYDWYEFTLNGTSDATLSLTNFVPVAGQMTVWQGDCQNLTLIGHNGDFSATKTINLTNQAAGTYYIWIINDGPINNVDKYNLLITTP